MKHLIFPLGFIVLALACVTVCFTTPNMPVAELSKAMAVFLLLIAIKQLQQHA